MTTLLFARHGQASFGQENYDQLSDLGSKQAHLLGAQYAGLQRQIDGLMTGTLSRQRDSAKYFLQGYQAGLEGLQQANDDSNFTDLAQPQVLAGLNEFNHEDIFIKSNPKFATQAGVMAEVNKSPEPMGRLAELFYESMQRWHSGDFDEDYLESWPAFNARVQQTLQDIIALTHNFDSPKTLLIFTSGGVIAALTAALLGEGKPDSQAAFRITPSLVNTGVTSISLKEGKPRLLSLNEHTHLYTAGERYLTWH